MWWIWIDVHLKKTKPSKLTSGTAGTNLWAVGASMPPPQHFRCLTHIGMLELRPMIASGFLAGTLKPD